MTLMKLSLWKQPFHARHWLQRFKTLYLLGSRLEPPAFLFFIFVCRFFLLVADIIKIENLPTFSGQKTDKLIGFSVVGLAKNTLWVMNLGPLGSDKVVISWFRMFEILWISRVMPKSKHLWWRHFRSIMMSSEVKLVWHPRFWVELSFATKIFEFWPSRISLDLRTWDLLFNFQSRKNR